MSSIGIRSKLRKRRAAHTTIWNAARQVGVDPLDRTEVLDLAAVAITRLAWRDSPIEDWHADPDSRISDPELMRANAATTRLIRCLLELQVPEAPDKPTDAVQCHTDADELFASIGHALAAPDRRLPDTRTVGELSPGRIELASYQDHVAEITREWTNAANQLGTHALLVLLAVTAASTCRDWWLAPGWPDVVAEFIACVKDPERAGSPAITTRLRTLARPAQASDPDQLRRLLLAGPDRLDIETASFCLRTGLGVLLPIHDRSLPLAPHRGTRPSLTPAPRRAYPSTFLRTSPATHQEAT